jgi:hypothetical protein
MVGRSRVRRDRLEARGTGQLALAPIECHEGAKPQLERYCDVQYVSSAAPER